MDEEHIPIVFPPQIAETAKQPDVTIFSVVTKNVIIIIELSVPTEENLANAYARKKYKYQEVMELHGRMRQQGMVCILFSSRSRSGGFYNTSLSKCLASLGVPSGKRKTLMDTSSKTAWERAMWPGYAETQRHSDR